MIYPQDCIAFGTPQVNELLSHYLYRVNNTEILISFSPDNYSITVVKSNKRLFITEVGNDLVIQVSLPKGRVSFSGRFFQASSFVSTAYDGTLTETPKWENFTRLEVELGFVPTTVLSIVHKFVFQHSASQHRNV